MDGPGQDSDYKLVVRFNARVEQICGSPFANCAL